MNSYLNASSLIEWLNANSSEGLNEHLNTHLNIQLNTTLKHTWMKPLFSCTFGWKLNTHLKDPERHLGCKQQVKHVKKWLIFRHYQLKFCSIYLNFLTIQDMKPVITMCTTWNNIGVNKKLWYSACQTIKYQTLKEAKEILEARCRYHFDLFFIYKHW